MGLERAGGFFVFLDDLPQEVTEVFVSRLQVEQADGVLLTMEQLDQKPCHFY